MKIIMITSELSPFAKTGGLADMVSMLSGALSCSDIEVYIIIPFYSQISEKKYKIENLKKSVSVFIAGRQLQGDLFKGHLPGLPCSSCTVYFIKNREYYDRPFLYGNADGDYADNCERFVFFSKSSLELIKALDLNPDIIHCHDWQTALIPVYLATDYQDDVVLGNVKSLFTIHNLAYQGVFWHWDWPLTSLDWSLFSWQGLEFYGKINLLKGGIVFADAISTVSKTYSREIMTPEYGCGLDGVLRSRKDNIFGIVNGMDYDLWNPEDDKCIKSGYSIRDLSGKRKCKAALQKELKLEIDPGVPLVAMIGRIVEQNGIDLLEECYDAVMQEALQLVILGIGSRYNVEKFKKFASRYPEKSVFVAGYDDRLARRMYAGSDMLLMPSLFEPCGYSQLIAMRYGSVPVVHSSGGLADTVIDLSPEGIEDGTSTGFVFLESNPAALYDEIDRALNFYADAENWNKIVYNCMNTDWSFLNTADNYTKLYNKIYSENKPES